MTRLRDALLLCTALFAGACGSSTDQGLLDNLPAPGTAAYAVDFIGSGHDTTYNYTASAITYANTCIYLQNSAWPGGLSRNNEVLPRRQPTSSRGRIPSAGTDGSRRAEYLRRVQHL
jgi:hypothetical protein